MSLLEFEAAVVIAQVTRMAVIGAELMTTLSRRRTQSNVGGSVAAA